MVALLDKQATELVHPEIIRFEREDSRMAGTMEVALRWRASGQERIRGFANSRPTPGGGTHVMGFRHGVSAAVSTYARERGLLTAMDPEFDTDLVGEGLTAVVSVKLERPEFEGAMRDALGNRAAHACVREAVAERLGWWLEEHPQQAAGASSTGSCMGFVGTDHPGEPSVLEQVVLARCVVSTVMARSLSHYRLTPLRHRVILARWQSLKCSKTLRRVPTGDGPRWRRRWSGGVGRYDRRLSCPGTMTAGRVDQTGRAG
jgi:hypothetical protein